MGDPTPDDLDDMHHALGRPVDAFQQTYRNFYCVDASNPLADHMASSPCWDRINVLGKDPIFRVTERGRQALDVHLRTRLIPTTGEE